MNSDGVTSESSEEDITPSLIAKLRDGDPTAGTLLDSLYREKLVRFCWGYLSRIDEAEDAVQEVCYRVLSATSVPDQIRPWLYKTARNLCFDLLRERYRNRGGRALPDASELHEVLTGHLTRLVKDEQKSRLGALVRDLPETQREVLRLRYVEDLPRTEIAAVLDIPESVVKSRLFEGLKKLRDQVPTLEDS